MAAVQSEKVKGLGSAAASLNLLLCQDMMASRACYCVDSLIMVDVGVKPFRTFFGFNGNQQSVLCLLSNLSTQGSGIFRMLNDVQNMLSGK